MLSHLEIYIQSFIKEEPKGFFASLLRGILRTMSWGFRFAVFCRNWAFDQGWLKRYYPPVPVVVSVGNIVAGGTGKTPVTQLITKSLCQEYTTAILSRGYRSPAEKYVDPLMLSKGEGALFPANVCGDEPYLLSKSLPEAFVFVGKDRKKASNMAAKAGAQLIVLDDGMQHRQLARDFEIVVINAQDPFGKGYFLPRGFLRDSPHSLSRADIIIINHAYSEELFSAAKKRVEKYTKAPCVGAEVAISSFFELNGKLVGSLQGKKVGLFCGIGYPEQFKSLIQRNGAHIIGELYSPDHLNPSQTELLRFASQSAKRGADFLICTEKDKVKLPHQWKGVLPIVWAKGDLRLSTGKEHWDAFIQQIRSKIRNF